MTTSPIEDRKGRQARVRHDARVPEVIDHFRRDPDLRVLGVVDAEGRAVGAICEVDVRAILLNPFGHALMINPGIRILLRTLMRQLPLIEAGSDDTDLLRIYAKAGQGEGVILVRDGRFAGTIDSRATVRLAAERDLRAAGTRVAVPAASIRPVASLRATSLPCPTA